MYWRYGIAEIDDNGTTVKKRENKKQMERQCPILCLDDAGSVVEPQTGNRRGKFLPRGEVNSHRETRREKGREQM